MHLIISALLAAAPVAAVPPRGVDPLAARVDDSDARRFARLWAATKGEPTAAQLDADYIAKGSRGVAVFTPGRIESGARMLASIVKDRAVYADAVERCLPWVELTNAELRATYLGMKGLLPERPLPVIAVVIGGNNSGGTAAEGIQVIGLEVICRLSRTRAEFTDAMRQFFAHETVHTFQPGRDAPPKDFLLHQALEEGVADYITQLVTARVPNPARAEWAAGHEAFIWNEFEKDRTIVSAGTDAKGSMDKTADAAFHRWFGNAGDPPKGWPDELGYWVGMRIAEHYVAASRDQHAAIETLLDPANATSVLRASRYDPRANSAPHASVNTARK